MRKHYDIYENVMYYWTIPTGEFIFIYLHKSAFTKEIILANVIIISLLVSILILFIIVNN